MRHVAVKWITHFYKSRRLLVPVGPGTDRDLGLQQGPGLGARTALELQTPALPGQPAVDRGRRHPAQLRRRSVVQVQLTAGPQPAHHLRQERRHPLTRRGVHHRPHRAQRHHHVLAIGRRPTLSRCDHPARSERSTQRLAGVVTMPARQLTQLVQNPGLTHPRRRPVPRRRRPRNRLALAHRQSHVRGWPDPNAPVLTATP